MVLSLLLRGNVTSLLVVLYTTISVIDLMVPRFSSVWVCSHSYFCLLSAVIVLILISLTCVLLAFLQYVSYPLCLLSISFGTCSIFSFAFPPFHSLNGHLRFDPCLLWTNEFWQLNIKHFTPLSENPLPVSGAKAPFSQPLVSWCTCS